MFPSTSNGVHHHNHSLSLNTINTTSTTNGRYDDDDDDGGGGSGGGGGCIEHQVSQMDTLAGVAIKYGVEVADIKRMNGLATDLQMYALKSLQIPPLRRHPPAPTWTNGTPPHGCAPLRFTDRPYVVQFLKKTPHINSELGMRYLDLLKSVYGIQVETVIIAVFTSNMQRKQQCKKDTTSSKTFVHL